MDKILQTPHPLGFNDITHENEGNISRLPDFEMFSLFVYS